MKKRLIVVSVLCLIAFSLFVSAFTINSPDETVWYNSRTVLFDLEADETNDFSYIKNIGSRRRWSKLCSKVKFCEKLVRLREGENNIAIKALDLEFNNQE